MKLSLQILTLLLTVTSCSSNNSSDQSEKSVNEVDQITQLDEQQKPISQTDTNKLRQGTKKLYHNGKLWKVENYKDGELHGKNYEYWENGEVMMTEYKNGIRDGYYMHYVPGESSAKFITKWSGGQKLWSTFPSQIEEQFVPIKEFIYEYPDTIRIEVPYVSGAILSKGTLVGQEHGSAIPIGEHQVFYESGELKALINYDTDTVRVFNKQGKQVQKSTTSDWKWKEIKTNANKK